MQTVEIAGGDNWTKKHGKYHYVSNYCTKSKKLNPWPPKPLNIDTGQSFPTIGSIESLKKIVPQQHYFCQFLFSIVSIHDCHFVKQINFELFIIYAKLLAWLIKFLPILEFLFPPSHRPACAKNLNPHCPTIHFNPHLANVDTWNQDEKLRSVSKILSFVRKVFKGRNAKKTKVESDE